MSDSSDDAAMAIGGFACRRLAGRGAAIIALHGSGADETTMLPLARAIAPHAPVIAPRGRIDQDGERRWFRKLTPTRFDQADIRREAAAFAAFLRELEQTGGVDLGSALLLGYSNGGNLVHATMTLHPSLIFRAALLRCMPVLARAPRPDLSGTEILVVSGDGDQTYGPFAGRLVSLLRRRGARVEARVAAAGHLFGDEDARLVRDWWRPPRAAAG